MHNAIMWCASHANFILQKLPAEPARRGLASGARQWQLGLPAMSRQLRRRLRVLLQLWPLPV